MSQPHSVQITDENPQLSKLALSWKTARFSDDDGIASMDSLHEAGDSLVGVARMGDSGLELIGSGVMVGPGLLLTATHVLDEFTPTGPPPLFLTFLPEGARAWLSSHVSSVSRPSAFDEDRSVSSDLSLVSCTLNSHALPHEPLTLAPLQIALPLVGDRLWAFGYRQGDVDLTGSGITPLVSSGRVTAAFPHGRGDRMPSICVELEAETWGGMSGGPVANADGNVVGIVSSSFEGGPSYVTLIWDVVRYSLPKAVPWLTHGRRVDLVSIAQLGLVRIKGDIKRRRTGDVTINMTTAEIELLVQSSEPSAIRKTDVALDAAQLAAFEERWSDEMEDDVGRVALKYLRELPVSAVRGFLEAHDVSSTCLDAIRAFSVEDYEGVEEFEVIGSTNRGRNQISLLCGFDLRSVLWTLEVSTADYAAAGVEFDKHFFDVDVDTDTARLLLHQRCYFEAELIFDRQSEEFVDCSITSTGVHAKRRP